MKKISLLSSLLLIVLVFFVFNFFFSCSGGSGDGIDREANISLASGDGKVSLIIPDGALPEGFDFSSIAVELSAAPVLAGKSVFMSYNFKPDGLVFLKPVTIIFFDEAMPENGEMYFISENGSHEEITTEYDSATREISAQITHFSKYAIVIDLFCGKEIVDNLKGDDSKVVYKDVANYAGTYSAVVKNVAATITLENIVLGNDVLAIAELNDNGKIESNQFHLRPGSPAAAYDSYGYSTIEYMGQENEELHEGWYFYTQRANDGQVKSYIYLEDIATYFSKDDNCKIVPVFPASQHQVGDEGGVNAECVAKIDEHQDDNNKYKYSAIAVYAGEYVCDKNQQVAASFLDNSKLHVKMTYEITGELKVEELDFELTASRGDTNTFEATIDNVAVAVLLYSGMVNDEEFHFIEFNMPDADSLICKKQSMCLQQ